MAIISYTITKSCRSHPLSGNRMALSSKGQVRVNLKRLFLYGCMTLQDKGTPTRRTFQDASALWEHLLGLYDVYLREEQGNIVASARGEILIKVSELVGVACGMAVLFSAFGVHPNRLNRYQQTNEKRMDFEFYHKRLRYFHETKGITYESQVKNFKRAVTQQKNATKKLLRNVRAASGTVTLYQHEKRKNHSTHIWLMDPPINYDSTEVSFEGELRAILSYYKPIYEVSHLSGFAEWLGLVIARLDEGRPPPSRLPEGIAATERLVEEGPGGDKYGGTLFDRRITQASVETFATFDAASARLRHPAYFLGVDERITRLIRNCAWEELLSYEDPHGGDENIAVQLDAAHEAQVTLRSGVMLKEVPPTAEMEQGAANSFRLLRARWRQTQGS